MRRDRLSRGVPHYVVLLRPGSLIKSFTLRADRWAEAAGVCRFFRDDTLVHQVATADLLRVETYETDKEAQDALLAFRRAQAGGATLSVQDSVAARPRRRGPSGAPVALVAEGITFRVEERH